jgi:hypothetical protein
MLPKGGPAGPWLSLAVLAACCARGGDGKSMMPDSAAARSDGASQDADLVPGTGGSGGLATGGRDAVAVLDVPSGTGGGGGAGTGGRDAAALLDMAQGAGGNGGAATGGRDGSVPDRTSDGPPESPAGTTLLRLKIAPGSSYCDTNALCGNLATHITVRDQAGTVIGGNLPFCPVYCAPDCQPQVCPAIPCLPYAAAFTGQERVFDGGYYEGSTCGAGTACYRRRYVGPGRYVATMCATPGVARTPDAGGSAICAEARAPECMEVPFDFPSPIPVEVTLGLSTSRDR